MLVDHHEFKAVGGDSVTQAFIVDTKGGMAVRTILVTGMSQGPIPGSGYGQYLLDLVRVPSAPVLNPWSGKIASLALTARSCAFATTPRR
nr:UDP-glucose dehydrogenase [Raoultella sp. NCTC 9187]